MDPAGTMGPENLSGGPSAARSRFPAVLEVAPRFASFLRISRRLEPLPAKTVFESMGKSASLASSASLLAALLLAGLSGCARRTVKIPVMDGTPPITALDVVGQGKRIVLFSGDQPRTVEIGPGDSVVLIALGEDRDGGVKDLTLSGNAVAVCGDSAGDGKGRRSGSFARRHVLPALPGWRVPGTKSARYVLRADDFLKLCPPGELRGVYGAAGVRAVNYHGASSMSPTLEFRIAPPTHSSQVSQGSKASQRVFGPLPASDYQDTPRI